MLCEVGLFAAVGLAAVAVGLLWSGGWNVPVFGAVCATAAGALVGVGPICSEG